MLKNRFLASIDCEEPVAEALEAARVELFREYEKKKVDFNTAFTLLLQLEVHPALLRFLERVRSQGHHLELEADPHRSFDQFLHRSFSLRVKGQVHPLVFTFTGNFDHRKVFVYTEYNATTTINVYDPAQINEPLLERLVLKGLGKIVPAS